MKTRWKVIEDIDGAYVYPLTANQTIDDLVFSRVRPVAKLNEDASIEAIRQFCDFVNGQPDRRTRSYRRSLALQREHEARSNADAVRDGAVIQKIL